VIRGGTFINEKRDLSNMGYERRYECGTCRKTFTSKRKLKAHQKKQNPRHHGFVEKLMNPKNISTPTTTTQKTTYQKSKGAIKTKRQPVAGNRSKKGADLTKNPSTYRAAHKDSGVLEPTYDSGFFRIDAEKLNEIEDFMPDGCEVYTVPRTQHKIIDYTGDAYNEIDFLMYLHNFCELEMFYEDIMFCLEKIPSKQYIGIKDMNELGLSVISYVDGDVIMSEFEEQTDFTTMSADELMTSISDLTGVAVVFGKFKKDNTDKKKYGVKETKVETPVVAKTPTKDEEDSLTIADYPLDEKYTMLPKDYDPLTEEDDVVDVDEVQGDFMFYDRSRQDEAERIYGEDSDIMWNAEQFESQEVSRGWGGSRYSSWGKTTTYSPPKPVAEKYHPVYGIRGHRLLVDRYVDLTSIIEEGEMVESKDSETFEAPPILTPMPEKAPESAEVLSITPPTDREMLSRKNQAREIKKQKKSSNPDRLNVAITDVDTAYEWSLKQFQDRGLNMVDYIPHFRENYLSLQEECRLAIDIPRIDMPVIDPEEMTEFSQKLRGGSLDVFEPFAIGDEVYSPKDLIRDTPEALKFLQLGFEDGRLEDDVVEAKITKTAVGLMRPTQSQIWLDKLILNIIQFGNPSPTGAYDSTSRILTTTIAISQEGYILDGHHRYGQVALVNPTLKMQTLYIGMPIRLLIEIRRPYGNAIGNEQRDAEEITKPN